MDAFVGEIRAFPYVFAPAGWLPCNGQQVSQQEYQALFTIVQFQYGPNDNTNFTLPDLRGLVPMGAQPTPKINYAKVGVTGGQASVTLNMSQIPNHIHQIAAYNRPLITYNTMTNQPANNFLACAASTESLPPKNIIAFANKPSGTTTMNTATIGPTGGGLPHNNMMPYLTMHFFIAAYGYYPVKP